MLIFKIFLQLVIATPTVTTSVSLTISVISTITGFYNIKNYFYTLLEYEKEMKSHVASSFDDGTRFDPFDLKGRLEDLHDPLGIRTKPLVRKYLSKFAYLCSGNHDAKPRGNGLEEPLLNQGQP